MIRPAASPLGARSSCGLWARSECDDLQQAGQILARHPHRAPTIYMHGAPPRRRHTLPALTHPGPTSRRLRGAMQHEPPGSTPGGSVSSGGLLLVRRPSESRLFLCSIPAPTTSEEALYALRSLISGVGLPPPARSELVWPRRRAPLSIRQYEAPGPMHAAPHLGHPAYEWSCECAGRREVDGRECRP